MNPLLLPEEKIEQGKINTQEDLERLISIYGDDVLRTSYLYLKDKQRAEDAFQEVFLKIYKKYDSFKGKSSEKTWIISITINVCKDFLRSSWFKRIILTDNISHEKSIDDIDNKAIKSLENKILLDEVLALPTTLKDVIILYYYHEFNTIEISKILGIAEGTVRSRLHRAREILKSKIEGRIEYFG